MRSIFKLFKGKKTKAINSKLSEVPRTKKMLVAYSKKKGKSDGRSNFLLPLYFKNELGLYGSKKKSDYDLGLVVFTGVEMTVEELREVYESNFTSIQGFEASDECFAHYITLISAMKFGSVVQFEKTADTPFGFSFSPTNFREGPAPKNKLP